MHEFDNFDLNLIAGMNDSQREPLRESYWQEADPNKRMGTAAETFAEFDQRVEEFLPHLQDLPDQTMVFGHGMWIGMLIWKLLGFSAGDSLSMKSFRRFQNGLPMQIVLFINFVKLRLDIGMLASIKQSCVDA